ncbi:enolase C-terminal domain-like protein [Glutamicibacter sp. AGC84]
MAKVLLKRLEPFKLMFIEEPVLSENVNPMLETLRNSSTPIALGERLFSCWDFKGRTGQRSGGHHPAGSFALRWHHRSP